jgi:hypothetical protein
VIDAGIFLNADFGRVMIEGMNGPHPNRLWFSLLLSFAEAKESRVWLGDPQQHGLSGIGHNLSRLVGRLMTKVENFLLVGTFQRARVIKTYQAA